MAKLYVVRYFAYTGSGYRPVDTPFRDPKAAEAFAAKVKAGAFGKVLGEVAIFEQEKLFGDLAYEGSAA